MSESLQSTLILLMSTTVLLLVTLSVREREQGQDAKTAPILILGSLLILILSVTLLYKGWSQ